MKKVTILFAILCIFIYYSLLSAGFDITKPDAVGGGLIFTTQDRSSYPEGIGPESLGVGPGLEFFLKYNISPKVFLSAGTGIYSIKDKFLKTEFMRTTLFPTIEVKVGYTINQGVNISPIIFGGLHLFSYKSTIIIPEIPGFMASSTVTSDPFFDAAFLIGGGIEFLINESFTFHAVGDFRYSFTSDASPKPQFWSVKAGISYALKNKYDYGDEIEYPIEENEIASLDDLFSDEINEFGGQNEEADALSLLFQPEEASSSVGSMDLDYPDTEAGQLMAKINDLKNEMDQKTYQIEVLQAQVNDYEKTIAGYTGKAAGEYMGFGSESVSNDKFKNVYKTGLEKFYDKKYNEAIDIFNKLLETNSDHRLASNCQYWIGESYNGLGNYRGAIEAFNQVLGFRRSYKFDDALIMSGLLNLKLGNKQTAKENFQKLVSNYPESEYAPKAMSYLGRL
jgi:TolA-binding protein